MVTTAKSSNNHSSPSAPGDGNSLKFPRKNLPSLWAQVVRGGEPESAAGIQQLPASPSSSSSSFAAETAPECSPKVAPTSPVDNCNRVGGVVSSEGCEGNVDRSKKPVWKKPSNGVVESGPVMGAESWPALSVSTKGSVKLPAESSSKTVADGSVSTSQQGQMTSLSPPRRQATTNTRYNSATNYNLPNRTRSTRRVGGSGPSQSSNPPLPSPPPPFPVYQLPPVSYANMVPGVTNPATRDHYRSNNWDARPIVERFVPVMNKYLGSSCSVYFGPHPCGDGSYHNSYGSRRDQDHGNYVNTRDAFVSQPRMRPRGLLRHPPPPPNTAAYLGPQPIGPFAHPMAFNEFYYYQPVAVEAFTEVPDITHGSPQGAPHDPSPPPSFSTGESLSNMILKQIEYYFSNDNLVRDDFLKSKMDDQGWVRVTLIADFPRIRNLTSNIWLILDSLRTSSVVEVQGDKLRRKNEWKTWMLSPHEMADCGSISSSRRNNLTSNLQAMTLEETTKDESLIKSIQLSNGGYGTWSCH